MNKTLATILKIVGAVTVIAGIAAAVVLYLKKKGIICVACDCDCDCDFEVCDDCDCDCDEDCDDDECCCQCAEEAPADAE